jgi:hypothetical protein
MPHVDDTASVRNHVTRGHLDNLAFGAMMCGSRGVKTRQVIEQNHTSGKVFIPPLDSRGRRVVNTRQQSSDINSQPICEGVRGEDKSKAGRFWALKRVHGKPEVVSIREKVCERIAELFSLRCVFRGQVTANTGARELLDRFQEATLFQRNLLKLCRPVWINFVLDTKALVADGGAAIRVCLLVLQGLQTLVEGLESGVQFVEDFDQFR